MYETADDLVALQSLLDASHERGGEHLRSILLDDRRLPAQEVCDLLQDMCLLQVATVTATCEPRVGTVDGHFHRGHFYFGSSHESFRFRHLRARPQVSATHVRGEEMVFVVHGRATEIEVGAPEHRPFLDQLVGFYGQEWEEWGKGAAYARIDADTMFAARLPNA